MNIITTSMSDLQDTINTSKDNLIERLNQDHGLSLKAEEYCFLVRKKGWFGRVLESVFGWPDDNSDGITITLVRLVIRTDKQKE